MRKAADRSHAGREMREGAVGRESVEMGGGWRKGKLWEGEEDQCSGKAGEPGAEERRPGRELSGEGALRKGTWRRSWRQRVLLAPWGTSPWEKADAR